MARRSGTPNLDAMLRGGVASYDTNESHRINIIPSEIDDSNYISTIKILNSRRRAPHVTKERAKKNTNLVVSYKASELVIHRAARYFD